MRVPLICLLALVAVDAHAEGLVIRTLSASVMDTKADGKPWDPSGGAPDLKLILSVDGREVARCAFKDGTDGRCTPNIAVEVGAEAQVALTVVDVDLGRDDPIGVATAAGPIGPGVHLLTPAGRLAKASVELAAAPPTAPASSAPATAEPARTAPRPARRQSTVPARRPSTPRAPPSGFGWLLGLVIGALVGGLMVHVVPARSGRLVLGAIAVVAGFGVAAGLVFEQLSASLAITASQWGLGALAIVLGGKVALEEAGGRYALAVLAGGFLVFIGPLMIYGAIGILIIAVALAVLQS